MNINLKNCFNCINKLDTTFWKTNVSGRAPTMLLLLLFILRHISHGRLSSVRGYDIYRLYTLYTRICINLRLSDMIVNLKFHYTKHI